MANRDSARAGAFSLRRAEFADGGAIPSRYACDGDDVSPPLEWRGAPRETAALALVVDDRRGG